MGLKCSIVVSTGVMPGDPIKKETRLWNITEEDMQGEALGYIDKQGAAMNYAAVKMNPSKKNWVRLEWIWY